MTRCARAAYFAICLYLLLVCVVSGHSSVLLHEDTVSSQKDLNSYRYESSLEAAQAQNMIDTFLREESSKSRSVQLENPTIVRPSAESTQSSPNSNDHHRYSAMDHDNLNIDSYSDCSYHLAFTLIDTQSTHTKHFTSKLMAKFSNCLTSILLNINSTNLDSGALCVHLITDGPVRTYINDVIVRVHEGLVQKSTQFNYNQQHRVDDLEDDSTSAHRPLTKYFFIDSATVESKVAKLLPTLRTYFMNNTNSYYSNALFFYSMVLHHVIPKQVADRLILLDVDLQLEANLLELYEEFDRFKSEQVFGIAFEQQPVYRWILREHRRTNENTTAGSPPPIGFPGYNSGVLLLHLDKMRESFLYKSLLNDVLITHLCRKYRFRGHLGDQDFYTVAALDYPQLFHTLPCAWNRQLCKRWRYDANADVFDHYQCDAVQVKLYHGNCNSAMPSLTNYWQYGRKLIRKTNWWIEPNRPNGECPQSINWWIEPNCPIGG